MLTIIPHLSDYIFGVRASGTVTKDDLKLVLLPRLENLSDHYKEISYLLVLETNVENYL